VIMLNQNKTMDVSATTMHTFFSVEYPQSKLSKTQKDETNEEKRIGNR